jgi:phage FluMu protein Com
MGLLEEFNRYLTGRNSAKFLEFKCPRCADIGSYDQSFFSEPGCHATCVRCNFQFGLHPESIYFRCICGIGLRGIGIDSINPLEEFVWKCSSCARRMFVSEPSASKCVYLCAESGCDTSYVYSFDDARYLIEGSFLCSCGRRIRPPSNRFGKDVRLRCPGCSKVWNFEKSNWEQTLGCGHRVNFSKFESGLIPNVIDRVESPVVSTGMSNELAYRERLSIQTGQLERRLGAEPRRITYRRVIVTPQGVLAEELILE